MEQLYLVLKVISSDLLLIIIWLPLAAPEFLEKPSDTNVRQGETAVFACSATAEPVHSVRWEREGVVIAQFLSPDDQRSTIEIFCKLNCDQLQRNTSVTVEDKIELAGLGDNYGRLTITNANRTDAREYTCFITNVHGNLTASARLTVQGLQTMSNE